MLLLPYLEEVSLHDHFRLDEPWDSPANLPLLDQMPRVYAPLGVEVGPGLTFAQVFRGPGTAFEGPDGLALADFTDGLSHTITVIEAGEAVPWTRPLDLPFAPEAQLPALGGTFRAARSRPFDSVGVDGFHALLADGSVRFLIRPRIKEVTLHALITRNGNERVSSDEY